METTIYNERYKRDQLYWGMAPSAMCYKTLSLLPPKKPLKVLDLGCGEGQDAIFFARNGYEVTAFDLSPVGIDKAVSRAKSLNLNIQFFVADVSEFQPKETYDIVFSSGVLQYVPPEKRRELINTFKKNTNPDGIHVLHTFVGKPFVKIAPDAEANEVLWTSGEILTYYHDWFIEDFAEEIKGCMSSGVAHEHAHNRIFARKPGV